MTLRRGARRIGAAAPVILRDAIGLAGAAAVAYGAWSIYAPAGCIVTGVMLLATAWLLAGRD